MQIRSLEIKDAKAFSNLIIDMYSHIDDLEWFSPMPYSQEAAADMICSPRLFIVGAFEGKQLVGVSSLDYKCGKLSGKIDFPEECNTDKLVEIGFNIVHSEYRGHKIMQQLIDWLLVKIKSDGYEWAFTKVHKDNIASEKSCLNKGFTYYLSYPKEVKKPDFIDLAWQPFFSSIGKERAMATLDKFKDQEKIIVEYNIFIQRIQ